MQWIFKKKNIFKRAIFYFEIGKKCYTLNCFISLR